MMEDTKFYRPEDTRRKYQGRAAIGTGSLPYTFGELQHIIEKALSLGSNPGEVFEALSEGDWNRSLNYTIAKVLEEKNDDAS